MNRATLRRVQIADALLATTHTTSASARVLALARAADEAAADAKLPMTGVRISAAVVRGCGCPRCVAEAQKRSCPEQYVVGGRRAGAASATRIW